MGLSLSRHRPTSRFALRCSATLVRLCAKSRDGSGCGAANSAFAHKPIRFTLLSDTGSVVRKEQGWFWMRSGEQRICVGCHTGPERASENRVPAVLLRTTPPVDLTGAKALPRSVKG